MTIKFQSLEISLKRSIGFLITSYLELSENKRKENELSKLWHEIDFK